MSLIIETDLGRDPDDFFALCYLFAAGAPVSAITISPGDPDQVAIARLLLRELNLNIPVGVGRTGRSSTSSGGMHYAMLDRYGMPRAASHDGSGEALIAAAAEKGTPELFAIGPLESAGAYLLQGGTFTRATMQGGFLGYHLHTHEVERLPKFEGKETVATFNLNGNLKGAEALLNGAFPRRFAGKNVCHTLVYDETIHKQVKARPPATRAAELFHEAMDIYLASHDGKKFHDPAAAVCMLHPEIGTWVNGQLYREKGGWGTRVTGDTKHDLVLADIDREQLWNCIAGFY